jgi:hypothetical protein
MVQATDIEGGAMVARVLRAVGAVSLMVGAVLMVSGAASSAQNLVDVGGIQPQPPALGGLLPEPLHRESGSGDEETGSGQGDCGGAPSHEESGSDSGGCGAAEDHEGSGSGTGECGAAPDRDESGSDTGGCGAAEDHEGSGSGTGECGAAPDREESGSGAGECGAATHDDSDDDVASDSRDAYTTRTCERILGQPATGGLDTQTNPPAGSDVSPGDTIEVTLTWSPDAWSGDSLHKAINCVTVNGAFTMGLSVEEKPTANDGEFSAAYTIPDNAAEGCQVCDQGFVSGDSSGGSFGQERSDQVCFKVRAAATSSGTSPAPAPAAPAPAPATPAPVPAVVLGEQLAAPAPAPRVAAEVAPVAAAPVPQVLGDTLPRTGQETRRGPVLMAGIGLMFGGLGLIGGNRRPRRVLHDPT